MYTPPYAIFVRFHEPFEIKFECVNYVNPSEIVYKDRMMRDLQEISWIGMNCLKMVIVLSLCSLKFDRKIIEIISSDFNTPITKTFVS